MSRNFRTLLEDRWSRGNFVCVGLDIDPAQISIEGVVVPESDAALLDFLTEFNRSVIDQTHDLVCAFKPQIAHYEALGRIGAIILEATVRHVQRVAPAVPIILDAKRNDIGDTALKYKKMAYEWLNVDAITLNPYLGIGALKTFLEEKDRGAIILCCTSNPEAREFQDLEVSTDWSPGGSMPLYQYVAAQVERTWNEHGNCALVVGATTPEKGRMVRQIAPEMPFLIPGVGKQGGDVHQIVKVCQDIRGRGMIINSSRAIIYDENPRAKTEELRKQINDARML